MICIFHVKSLGNRRWHMGWVQCRPIVSLAKSKKRKKATKFRCAMDPSPNSRRLQMRACKPSIETFLHRADSLLIVAPHLINGLLHFEYERAAVEKSERTPSLSAPSYSVLSVVYGDKSSTNSFLLLTDFNSSSSPLPLYRKLIG